MEDIIIDFQRYRGPIRYWWVELLLGVLAIAMGIVILMHPKISFLTISILFGLGILVSGILDLIVAASMHRQAGKGWTIATGVIEILLGVLLISVPAVSLNIIPMLLAIWLLFRGFALIGISSDMMAWGVKGPGWVIAFASLLIFCAFIVLFNPAVGVGAIIIWLSVSFILLGIGFLILAYDLYRLRGRLR